MTDTNHSLTNNTVTQLSQRVTQAVKNKNDFEWYKNQARLLKTRCADLSYSTGFGGISEYKRKKTNYDLFNNIINKSDFEYVCSPYGTDVGTLPANFVNRDILSPKIKALLGMEMEMPFSWDVMAVNEEATTRKEQEEFKRIQDYVVAQTMNPIKASLEQQAQQQANGRKLSPDEVQKIQQQIEQQTDAQTPDEIRRYMKREHQDPAEVMASQLLQYIIKKENLPDKFNKMFKHLMLSAEEIGFVGIINEEPVLWVTNSINFDSDKSPDLDYIEDGEWCRYRLPMTPSMVLSTFGSQLDDEQIDKIYELGSNHGSPIYSNEFTFAEDSQGGIYTLNVYHYQWKGLRKVGFLDYIDTNTGRYNLKLVDESYTLNKTQGDIAITWEWIPETQEIWEILPDEIYVYARPVQGQHRDMDNLYNAKLSYYGALCDNLNSVPTCPTDRGKYFQYLYDIIYYRLELLIAKDKGKKIIGNIGSIPKSAGINTEQWMHFFDAHDFGWVNPNEEGNRNGGDVTNMFKEFDMSMVSRIDQYINLLNAVDIACGSAMGVSKQMEAGIGANEAVTNAKQNIIQSSHIVRPYYELHNSVKRNILTALLEAGKVAYGSGKQKKIAYFMDDMSEAILTIDPDLLDNSTYGLFVSNSSEGYNIKKQIEGLSHAAMQSGQATLGDVIRVLRATTVQEAEENLDVAADKAAQNAQAAEQSKQQAAQQAQQAANIQEQAQWKHEGDMIVLKEIERRKTEIQKQTILSLGFDANKDEDEDGTPDVLEVAKFGVDADIKKKQLQQKDRELDQKDKALDQKTSHDKDKLDLESKKITEMAKKRSQP